MMTTTMTATLAAVLLLAPSAAAFASGGGGFLARPARAGRARLTVVAAVAAPSLESRGSVLADGSLLSHEVRRHFDAEWTELAVHETLGEACAATYGRLRGTGVADVGEVMMAVGTELEGVSMGDAFVGPWDVANRVSDVLFHLLDPTDACPCSTQPTDGAAAHRAAHPVRTLAAAAAALPAAANEFERLSWMRQALEVDGPVSWDEIALVHAYAKGWVPEAVLGTAVVLDDLEAESVAAALLEQLPEEDSDEGDALRLFVETMYGLDALDNDLPVGQTAADRAASPFGRRFAAVATIFQETRWMEDGAQE